MQVVGLTLHDADRFGGLKPGSQELQGGFGIANRPVLPRTVRRACTGGQLAPMDAEISRQRSFQVKHRGESRGLCTPAHQEHDQQGQKQA